MQILALTTSYPTTAHPGSGVFIRRMLVCLPGHIRVRVLTPASRHPLTPQAPQDKIRILPFRYAPDALQTLAHQPGGIPSALQQKPLRWLQVPVFCAAMLLTTCFQARKADLIHANWSLCGLIAGLAGRLRAVPVVTTIRGSDVSWARRSVWCRWILKLCLALSQRGVTVGEAMARQLADWFPNQRQKIVTIPNGVRQGPGMGPPESSGAYTFAVIGNLIPLKNVALVIQALAMLSRPHADVRLWVIGEGPEKGSLRSLAHELGLDRQIDFKGQLHPDQVMDHLACCQALILASTHEGRPNVVLEAMAVGVPVIASDIDGVRELIVHGERGLLFAPGDLSQLTGQMAHLLARPDLALRLAGNARRWVQDQGLTWENTAARYADLYGLVFSQHRRGRL